MDERIQLAITVGDHKHPNLAAGLERAGLNVIAAESGVSAIRLIRAMGLRCLVVLTRLLPTRMAMEFLTRLQSEYPDCRTRFPVLLEADRFGHTDLPLDCPCVVGTVREADADGVESVVRSVL